MYHLHRKQQLHCSLDDAWDFFSNPRNLDKLTPSSVGFKITHCKSDVMHVGQMIGYRIKIAPMIWVKWLSEITLVEDKKRFIDDQRIGPYKVWHHTHQFEENAEGVLMTDDILYALPYGPLGAIAHTLHVKKKLQHIFDERRRLTEELFSA
ncbi:SRPBCC family protein [Rubritalea profundi]|uniref:Coenzyme Q-binding protein COQ10 START domain-containing protein n=1 Tax=Rubritalea profundi TaxID=1658618 RepID=A0A2S7U4S4_9BACT|nr:SRPBCC family protein [Rubritalea profundi]PQJ29517.1 hypothetical protein BSZ32_14125 [Rubritalea profundi]